MKTRLPDKEYEAILMDTIEQNKKLKLPLTYAKWDSQVSLKTDILDHRNFYAQSYVRNAFVFMTSISNQIQAINHPNRDMRPVDLAGISREPGLTGGITITPRFGEIASGSETDRGIIVGSSITPEAITDRHLPGLIPHGIAAGQLDHRPEHLYAVTYNTTLSRWEVTQARRFVNNSGNPITVNEIGLAARAIFSHDGGLHVLDLWNILLIRDVLPASITIPNTGQLTLTLTKFTAAAW